MMKEIIVKDKQIFISGILIWSSKFGRITQIESLLLNKFNLNLNENLEKNIDLLKMCELAVLDAGINPKEIFRRNSNFQSNECVQIFVEYKNEVLIEHLRELFEVFGKENFKLYNVKNCNLITALFDAVEYLNNNDINESLVIGIDLDDDELTTCVLFLQTEKVAKRVYACINEIIISNNFLEDEDKISKLILKSNYAEINKSQNCEIQSICEKLDKEIKVGSTNLEFENEIIQFNIGGILKAILIFNNNYIPPNTFDEELEDLENLSLVETKSTLQGNFLSLNFFTEMNKSFNILLKKFSNNDTDLNETNDEMPKLICASGRSYLSVKSLFDSLKSKPIDSKLISLLHNIYNQDNLLDNFRGYIILNTNQNKKLIQENIEENFVKKRSIWYLYSGMGSQWLKMGKLLLNFKPFSNVIEKCDRVLRKKNINIYNIINGDDKNIFDNILNCFLGITALQLGMTEILKHLGIIPDYIIGHSMGEVACAYADGSFTVEEAILTSYTRGIVSITNKQMLGAMASVGKGYNEIKNICPKEIEIACHNSPMNCTISGPKDIVENFVKELEEKNVFAKIVPVGNIAYHSHYIFESGIDLCNQLKEIIPNPKPRSSKWISTSIPDDQLNSDLAKFSSAEYHSNNFMNPVLLEEKLHLIQKDAVLIEIAPYGLLKAILKRTLPNTNYIALYLNEVIDYNYFLSTFGELYNYGITFDVSKFYNQIKYPVQAEMLASYFLNK